MAVPVVTEEAQILEPLGGKCLRAVQLQDYGGNVHTASLQFDGGAELWIIHLRDELRFLIVQAKGGD